MELPRWHQVRDALRRANHVLLAAVIVYMGQVLLGAVTAGPALEMISGLRPGSWLLEVAAPLIIDFSKVICLLLIAYPFGRVTAPRPWPSALGMTLLVYLFDFGTHFAFGTHQLTWMQGRALVGRGLLALIVLVGVALLVGRGRRAAEAAETGAPPPAAPAPEEEAAAEPKEPDPGEAPTSSLVACKQWPRSRVLPPEASRIWTVGLGEAGR